MKAILILPFIICLSIVGFCGKTRLEYSIKKDTLNEKIPLGKTKVMGTVLYGNEPVSGARISTLDHKTSIVSDKDGKFSFYISSKDTSLYMYKPGYEEIVINYYKFQSKHEVTIEFYPYETIIRPVKKPVVYLYNEESIEVEFSLRTHGMLTYTYPSFNIADGWQITTNTAQNGIFCNGKHYPYLFWEAQSSTLKFNKNNENQIEGFNVEKDSIVPFLANSLDQLGFNDKEKTDFITFWAPQMNNASHYVVQFLLDDDYEKEIATLSITPKPASSRRVYMLFSELNKLEDQEIIPQDLPGFERRGFTYIEWGGTDLTGIKKGL